MKQDCFVVTDRLRLRSSAWVSAAGDVLHGEAGDSTVLQTYVEQSPVSSYRTNAAVNCRFTNTPGILSDTLLAACLPATNSQ